MTKKPSNDRNFNEISSKFKNNIYGTGKGRIREAVLLRDLETAGLLSGKACLNILDAGGGQGQIALKLAQAGHRVTLLDISGEMLAMATEAAKNAGVSDRLTTMEAPLQSLSGHATRYDAVLCHAVFEWLENSREALKILTDKVKPGGLLSLMFYNKDAKRLANLLYGNFDFVANDMKVKNKVKLSPNNPLIPGEVMEWGEALGLKLKQKTGVRCIYDYMRDISMWDSKFDEIVANELLYSRQEPYASIGRYMHLLYQLPRT